MPRIPAELPRPEELRRLPTEHPDYELVYKPPALPTLSADCLDLWSLQAVLAWSRGAISSGPSAEAARAPVEGLSRPRLQAPLVRWHPEIEWLEEEGLLHRLDNFAQGWVPRARSQTAYEAYSAARSNYQIASFYHLHIPVAPVHQDSLWVQVWEHVQRRRAEVAIQIVDKDTGMHLIAAEQEGDDVHLAVGAGMENVGPRTRTQSRALANFHVSVLRVKLQDVEQLVSGRANTRQTGGGGQLDGAVKVEAQIRRGARHQLRVHLAAMGTPLAHDRLYGADPESRQELALYSMGSEAAIDGHRYLLLAEPESNYWRVSAAMQTAINQAMGLARHIKKEREESEASRRRMYREREEEA